MPQIDFKYRTILEKSSSKLIINGIYHCSIPECLDFYASWCTQETSSSINIHAQEVNYKTHHKLKIIRNTSKIINTSNKVPCR